MQVDSGGLTRNSDRSIFFAVFDIKTYCPSDGCMEKAFGSACIYESFKSLRGRGMFRGI